MIMDFDFQRGQWLFTDDFGQVWRLRPSGDEDMPLIISIEERANVRRFLEDRQAGRVVPVTDERLREMVKENGPSPPCGDTPT